MATVLGDNALTTLQAVHDELGITTEGDDPRDRLLLRYIQAASDAAERVANRSFYYEVDKVEAVAGTGGKTIQVSKHPLLEIDSITYDGTAVDATGYEIHNPAIGTIYRIATNWIWTAHTVQDVTAHQVPGTERKLYEVTYTGGYVTPWQEDSDETETLVRTLPSDLEDGVIQLVATRYRAQGRDRSVKSERLMSYSATYRDEDIPEDIRCVFERYRRGP